MAHSPQHLFYQPVLQLRPQFASPPSSATASRSRTHCTPPLVLPPRPKAPQSAQQLARHLWLAGTKVGTYRLRRRKIPFEIKYPASPPRIIATIAVNLNRYHKPKTNSPIVPAAMTTSPILFKRPPVSLFIGFSRSTRIFLQRARPSHRPQSNPHRLLPQW